MPRGVYKRKPKVELSSLEAKPRRTQAETDAMAREINAQAQWQNIALPPEFAPILAGMAQSCARCHYFDVGSDPRYGLCLRYPQGVPVQADRTKCGEFKAT